MKIHVCDSCGILCFEEPDGRKSDLIIRDGRCTPCLMGFKGMAKIHEEAVKFRKEIFAKKNPTEGEKNLMRVWASYLPWDRLL